MDKLVVTIMGFGNTLVKLCFCIREMSLVLNGQGILHLDHE